MRWRLTFGFIVTPGYSHRGGSSSIPPVRIPSRIAWRLRICSLRVLRQGHANVPREPPARGRDQLSTNEWLSGRTGAYLSIPLSTSRLHGGGTGKQLRDNDDTDDRRDRNQRVGEREREDERAVATKHEPLSSFTQITGLVCRHRRDQPRPSRISKIPRLTEGHCAF